MAKYGLLNKCKLVYGWFVRLYGKIIHEIYKTLINYLHMVKRLLLIIMIKSIQIGKYWLLNNDKTSTYGYIKITSYADGQMLIVEKCYTNLHMVKTPIAYNNDIICIDG